MRAISGLFLVVLASAPAAAQEFWLPAPLDSLLVAARADSNDPIRHHAVALAHLNRRKLGDAERAFRDALGADSRYAPAQLGLAIVAMERRPEVLRPPSKKPPSPAVLAARDSLLGRFRHAILLDPLVELDLPGTPPYTSTSDYRQFEMGWAAEAAFWSFLAGAFARAYELTQWVIEQYETFQVRGQIPDDVLWIHALAAARLGRFEPGVRDLTRLMERSRRAEDEGLSPLPRFLRTNDLRYMLAFLRARAGQTTAAANTYREVLVSDLGYWMAHVRLGDLLETMEQWDGAVQERERAWDLNPDDPTLLADLGVTLARASRLAAADSVLRQATLRLPRAAYLQYHLGETARARHDTAAARAAYRAFLAMAPARMEREIAAVRRGLEALEQVR